MNSQQSRLILCTKDMMQVMGKSKATITRMRKGIRERSRKNKYAMITLEEFCEFTGLSEEKVCATLK